MFNTIFGLPTHILVIHAVVVGIPLAAIATAAIAIKSAWRAAAGIWVLVLDALVVIATYLARESGIDLYADLPAVTQRAAAHHRALGLTLIWFTIAVLVAAALLVLADRWGSQVLSGILIVITLATCVLSVVRVIQVGDAGARATWGGVVQTTHTSH
jgi:hypothetical protein